MEPTFDIKARLPIEALVGEYVQLKKKGRNFVGLCPFHNDTKPSFLVSPDKGICYCFPCQKGGDIFSFYQEIEGVDFPQALKDLAEKTGVELPKMSAPQGPKKDEKDSMRECLEKALKFYRIKLREDEQAKSYAKERHIDKELVDAFEIGFAPDSFDATYNHLLKSGCSRSEVVGAGLGIQKELEKERIYDRFRNRLMFPIRDHQGKLIGFGGRTLGDDDAKYINSPDGPLYNKSVALFGIHLAKEAMRESKSVILVEGYFDVLAFHRIGIKNVVAVSGTALTEQHVILLKRHADTILLCLDADQAGQQAAERCFMLCATKELDVRTLTLPTGKDPDECATLVPDELRRATEAGGTPYLRELFVQLKESNEDTRTILKRIVPLLNCITSTVEKEDAVQEAAKLLGTTVTALKDDMKKEEKPVRQQEPQTREVASPYSATELLLGWLLTYPMHRAHIEKMLEPEGDAEKKLYNVLREAAKGEDLETKLKEAEIEEYASVLTLFCEERYGTWSESLAEEEIQKQTPKVNSLLLDTKRKQLIEEIRSAKEQGKKGEEEKLLTQYQQVLKLAAMAS